SSSSWRMCGCWPPSAGATASMTVWATWRRSPESLSTIASSHSMPIVDRSEAAKGRCMSSVLGVSGQRLDDDHRLGAGNPGAHDGAFRRSAQVERLAELLGDDRGAPLLDGQAADVALAEVGAQPLEAERHDVEHPVAAREGVARAGTGGGDVGDRGVEQ